MITRWFIAISQFSHKIEFISGVDNGIADLMSRLYRNNMIDSPVEYRPHDIMSANIIEKFKLSSFQYRSIAALHNSYV